MSISRRTGLKGNSSVKPQPPHLTVARPSSLNSSTLMASFPHLGHRKTLGIRFLGIRTTFLRLLPISRPLSLRSVIYTSSSASFQVYHHRLNTCPKARARHGRRRENNRTYLPIDLLLSPVLNSLIEYELLNRTL